RRAIKACSKNHCSTRPFGRSWFPPDEFWFTPRPPPPIIPRSRTQVFPVGKSAAPRLPNLRPHAKNRTWRLTNGLTLGRNVVLLFEVIFMGTTFCLTGGDSGTVGGEESVSQSCPLPSKRSV